MKSGSKKADTLTQRLFRNPSGQDEMFDKSLEEELEEQQESVECLGRHFANDAARREYYTAELSRKLKDPEFRKIEGFPDGSDDDILRLSDPPYYTACPNPFIADFVRLHSKPLDSAASDHERTPFAVDVTEGKNDPIYNAHTYHTKVPHKAIMRYILHYTNPGDLILDFFCGTGMTGVAAQECSSVDARYPEMVGIGTPGQRFCVLVDLAPIATTIAQNYVKEIPLDRFERLATALLSESLERNRWMYETRHTGWPALSGDPSTWENQAEGFSSLAGIINFVVWSEHFICKSCSTEFPLWKAGVDPVAGTTRESFPCPSCGTLTSKRQLTRSMETAFDPMLGKTIRRVKRSPALINYTVNGKRFEKFPDDADLAVLKRISELKAPRVPTNELPRGERRLKDAFDLIGVTHCHHFFFSRTLHALSDLWDEIGGASTEERSLLTILFTSQLVNVSVMNRFRRVSFPYNPMSGTLYVGSVVSEANPYIAYQNKIQRFKLAKQGRAPIATMVSTQSATALTEIPDHSVDYIFIDPPFGRNLHYSELNYVWECWLRVITNRHLEAVMDRGRDRELYEYQHLMREALCEAYRVLKPGRWITVEFHNASNAVWNAIQESIFGSGFVVADVRTLDKQAETFKQSQQGLVKADLIISAYKPTAELEQKFKLEAGTEQGAWDFIRAHLHALPVFIPSEDSAEVITERQAYLLYDRMVAYHVERGVSVPLSASEFFAGLNHRFPTRDGMFFLPDQVGEYDRRRMMAREVRQFEIFVRNEKSAIQWLRQELLQKPQTYQDLYPQFMKEIAGWQKHERLLDLKELLDQNFLVYDGQGDVPSQIHGYLSTSFHDLRKLSKNDAALRAKGRDRYYVADPTKDADIQKVRERALLREFGEYREAKQKKLKVFRLEAIRTGFHWAWQQNDYNAILDVADKIPEDVLQEDPMLLMWYTNSLTRAGRQS